jgi:hypothetical protein
VSTLRHPAAAARFSLVLVGLVAVASGCALASPTTITTPYAASDGTNADLLVPGAGTVKFRDFLLVSAAKDAPGVLVGAVTTDAGSPLRVQLSVLGTDGNPIGQTMLTTEPGQLSTFGADGTSLQVADVPLPPGSMLEVHAQTAAGGTDFELPVLAPTIEYSSITPTATVSTTTATPTAKASGRPSASRSGSGSPSPAGSS